MEAKQIRLKSEADFQRLRDRINREVSHARHHWGLFKGLQDASAEYALEVNERNTFWYLTFIAHLDAVGSHLRRLYDKYAVRGSWSAKRARRFLGRSLCSFVLGTL